MEQQQQPKRDWQNMRDVDRAAAWIKTSKAGVKYLSGIVEIDGQELRFALFKNNFKKNDKQPDYVFGNKKKEETQQATTQETSADPLNETADPGF